MPINGMSDAQQPQTPPVNAEATPANPQRGTQEQRQRLSGLTEEDENLIVSGIIQPYRNQWSTDRIMRMPSWLKAMEFDKGHQVLGWDPISRTYFDAIAYSRQNNQETDYTYLEKYVNNITQTVRRNFTAAVARAVPPVVIRPENAENLADMTTAKAAQEAIGIIEEANDVRGLLGLEAQYLYLYGVYFKWTRFVIDGTWMGYKDEAEFGDVNVQLSQDHFHCLQCGADTDANKVDSSNPDNMQCPNCTGKLRPQDFQLGEDSTVIGQTGVKKKANGLPKWSVYGPLQVDTDPTKEHIHEVPVLALEWETDAAEIRATYPDMAGEIEEGAESGTNENASYERLVRTMVYSSGSTVTADIFSARGTFSIIWVQPNSYYRVTGNPQFIQRMQKLFPAGCKVSMWGSKVLNVEKAVLSKEWTACKLHKGYGLYPPSVADNVVPFNERFNNISNILDDYMERCATGITLVDPRRMDMREMSGKPLTGGVLNGIPSKGEGVNQPLSNAIYHFAYEMDPGLFSYLDRLWNYCQLISGVPPQVGGTGTMEGVETAKGQKQMLDQALGSLGDIYDQIKTEHANAGQNAIECLQENMRYTGSLWTVIEENGSEFRNNYVHLDEMQGRVRVKANTDEGLPMTPEQKRQWCENIMEMAKENNPAAIAWLDETSNQQLLNDYWGLPGSVSPGSAQRSKTLQDIRKLLEFGTQSQQPMYMMGPNGQPVMDDDGTPMVKPPIAPDKWVENYSILKPTLVQFCAENCDVKQENPVGWSYVVAFYRLACNYEAQVQGNANKLKMQAEKEGQPPPPAPNPSIQAMEAKLLSQASDAADQLHEFAHVPITVKTTSAPIQAAKELIDVAVKTAGRQ